MFEKTFNKTSNIENTMKPQASYNSSKCYFFVRPLGPTVAKDLCSRGRFKSERMVQTVLLFWDHVITIRCASYTHSPLERMSSLFGLGCHHSQFITTERHISVIVLPRHPWTITIILQSFNKEESTPSIVMNGNITLTTQPSGSIELKEMKSSSFRDIS